MSEERYEPISCDYHDELEAAAVTGREIDLEFDSNGVRQRERGTIADVFTRDGGEFVRLRGNNGSIEVRLDQIVSMRDVGTPAAQTS